MILKRHISGRKTFLFLFIEELIEQISIWNCAKGQLMEPKVI
jgi:hypothetical protein